MRRTGARVTKPTQIGLIHPNIRGLTIHMKRRQLLAEHIFIANIRRHFDRTIGRDQIKRLARLTIAVATERNIHRIDKPLKAPRNHLTERQQMDFVITRRMKHILIRVQPQAAVEILRALNTHTAEQNRTILPRRFGLIQRITQRH